MIILDFETRSTVNLALTGVYPYAEDGTTDIWCMAYQMQNGGDVGLWRMGEDFPRDLRRRIEAGEPLAAWNAQFERVIWDNIGTPRYGFPAVAIEQWHCSAARAAAMGLPRSLEKCGAAMGLTILKDNAGHDLMLRMARPRRLKPLTWWDVPDRLERLYEYCRQDVRAERAIDNLLSPLRQEEWELYWLDQRINDRGMYVDRALAMLLQQLVKDAQEDSAETIYRATRGQVSRASEVQGIRRWLATLGVETDSLDKQALQALLERGDLPDAARQVLEQRLETGKASVAKLDKMLMCTTPTNPRARGMLLFNGASTGRWSGRLIQLQNLPRPEIERAEEYIPLLNQPKLVAALQPPVELASSLLRACMTAAPGKQLISGDYAGIEARVVNWLAGQDDVLDLFRRGIDVYVRTAAKLFGIPPEQVTKDMRQVGKAIVLGCGFGMGAEKFKNTAYKMYQLTLDDATSKEYVDFYRRAHHAVRSFWYELSNSAMRAVQEPGSVVRCGKHLKFTYRAKFLWMILPSRRPLAYAFPQIVDGKYGPALEASGVNSFTRKWERYSLYGGLLAENATQAVARDIMANGMKNVEADPRFEIVLTVHDEVVAEFTKGIDEAKAQVDFEAHLTNIPEWASGCPITAESWIAPRYRK